MLRLWGWLSGGLALLLLMLVGVVRLQPYDDSALRLFFIPPENCAAPCWLGIRPGVTTVDEALGLLTAHEWVAGVRQNSAFYDLEWSGKQPVWIDTTFRSHFRAQGDVVESVRVRTTLPTGAIMALLGRPETGVISSPLNQAGLRHTARYTRSGVEISSLSLCPLNRDSLWYAPVEVQYRDIPIRYRPYHYTLRDWLALRPCR